MRGEGQEMRGSIGLEGLELECRLGVPEEERHSLQTVFVDIEIWADLAGAIASDRIEEAIDYAFMAQDLRSFVKDREFHLIERLASELVDRLFAIFPALEVRLRLSKPLPLFRAIGSFVELRVQRG